MPLIRLDRVSLAYGHRALLDTVNLDIRRGERVCLVGRNGEGKSSLMRVIGGEAVPDDGEVWIRPGMRVAHLAQEMEPGRRGTVFDAVAGGLPKLAQLIIDYHHAARELGHTPGEAAINNLAELQHAVEAAGGWRMEQRVETVLSRLALDGDAAFAALSGGWRRRVMLARALVCEPDVLLLDEPTNHLDIAAITWLEDFMADYPGALLFISHDRAFVRRLSTRIVELDRGQLTSWPGSFAEYQRRKSEQLEAEAQQNARFDKKLSREEAWIRQGIKARRTRNEGRVRQLKKLREQRRHRRDRIGKVNLKLEDGELSGKLVFDVERVSLGFDGKPVIRDFTARILRGDRVGIIGPNGAGKSTLIRLLLGECDPDAGRIKRGTRLQIAYFDQQREQLDAARTVMENVAGGSQSVTINGRSRHVAGYLRDFLFPGERLQSPVSTLSGGERNRLLLARLFTQPANLLVLDEPTNDLDVETLELLEELLMEFEGTLLLVSHDRAFLDNVVTSTLVFEGDGHVGEYVGGYSDWLRQRRVSPKPVTGGRTSNETGKNRAATARASDRVKPGKLSYRDQRELDALPARIEALEAEQAKLQSNISSPGFYQQDQGEITAALERLDSLTSELEVCYDRWSELEE